MKSRLPATLRKTRWNRLRLDFVGGCAALIKLVIMLSIISSASAETVQQQILSSVKRELQHNLAADAANSGRRIEFQVNQLDPRLQLAPCDQPLNLNYDRNKLSSRLSVQVQCRGSMPWSIYVPVQISAWQNVVITRHALARGQQLRAEDLDVAEVDLTTLRYGYFIDPEQVLGMQVKRSLNPNEALYPGVLDAAQVVNKGDAVTIRAKGVQIAVRAPGIALSDGKIGEQISVRNNASQRVIRARVVERGLVEVQI